MDAVTDITETELKLSGVPAGSRSNQIWTHRVGSTFLDTFGRPDPNQDPPCERTSDSTVTQALHLMNSEQLHSRIRNAGGRAARLAESDFSDDELLNELYLAVYSRYPNEAELQFGRGALRDGQSDRRATVEDLLWALMNTKEFMLH